MWQSFDWILGGGFTLVKLLAVWVIMIVRGIVPRLAGIFKVMWHELLAISPFPASMGSVHRLQEFILIESELARLALDYRTVHPGTARLNQNVGHLVIDLRPLRIDLVDLPKGLQPAPE